MGWYNEVDYYYEQMEKAENGEEDEEEDDGEEPEAAEWCEELVQEDAAVDIYDCGGYEAEEEENNDDDFAAKYDWYNFELTADQAEGIGAVCSIYTAVAAYDDAGEYSGYTPYTVYNGENGALFNYERGSTESESSGMSGGA